MVGISAQPPSGESSAGSCAQPIQGLEGGGGGGFVRGSCLYLLGGFFSAHNLQQGHDVGRAEEVCANDAILGLCLLANEVNVNGGGVTGQDAVGPTYALQICNTPAPCCTVPSSTYSGMI